MVVVNVASFFRARVRPLMRLRRYLPFTTAALGAAVVFGIAPAAVLGSMALFTEVRDGTSAGPLASAGFDELAIIVLDKLDPSGRLRCTREVHIHRFNAAARRN